MIGIDDASIYGEMTWPGRSALRVIRVSGKRSREAAKKLFLSKSDPFKKPRTAVNGILVNLKKEKLDSIISLAFKSPNSYTGEDLIEFHCHGSRAVVSSLCGSLKCLGLREALPGEFSYRGFLAGKISLKEAESLQQLIEAQTEMEVRASELSKTAISRSLSVLSKKMIALLAKWEARIEFPGEVPQEKTAVWIEEIGLLLNEMKSLEKMAAESRPLREGFRIALFGAPNSGKSSLFNNLLGKERAIVTPHPGTTRDIIEEKLDFEGIPIIFQDMAGVRNRGVAVENYGISMAIDNARSADGVLFLFDGSKGWRKKDEDALTLLSRKPLFFVAAKKDLYQKRKFEMEEKVVEISNQTPEGIDELIKEIKKWAKGRISPGSFFLFGRKQEETFLKVLRTTKEGENALKKNRDELLAAELLKMALEQIDRLLLKPSQEEVYDTVFSSFCIGK